MPIVKNGKVKITVTIDQELYEQLEVVRELKSYSLKTYMIMAIRRANDRLMDQDLKRKKYERREKQAREYRRKHGRRL